jgi:pimeloyl-ACP methyl ester carboxylesterase
VVDHAAIMARSADGYRAAMPTRLTAVPGLGLGPESWRPTLAALGAEDVGSIEPLPGYGVPLDPGPTPTPGELALELLARLAGPTTLLGHSASCQVVAHAARLAPGTVRGLILVGPTTDPRARTWSALAALWLRAAGHEDPRQVPRLVRQYHRTTLRSMKRTMDAARRDDLVATLSAVSCPVALVRGARDRIARADWLGVLAGTGRDRAVVELPQGGHLVPITHPALLARSIAPWLEEGALRP